MDTTGAIGHGVWVPDEDAEVDEVVDEITTPGTREMDLVQASAQHLVQDSLPMANDAERDAAARSVARAAEAAGNVATGLPAGGLMNLGAAGPLGASAISANGPGAAANVVPDGDEHISLSAARSGHDAAPLGEVTLPNDYTVRLSQAARRGDPILYFTSMIGIRPGHRFLVGNPPVIEIIVVERLCSVITGAPMVHNHPIGVPCRFIKDDSGVVEQTLDQNMDYLLYIPVTR